MKRSNISLTGESGSGSGMQVSNYISPQTWAHLNPKIAKPLSTTFFCYDQGSLSASSSSLSAPSLDPRGRECFLRLVTQQPKFKSP